MPLTKLKDKGQVTIPSAIREEIGARQGDIFEVAIADGSIVLKPQDVVSRSGSRNQPHGRTGVDITRWIGSGKGLFETPEEVDAFIRSERARWE